MNTEQLKLDLFYKMNKEFEKLHKELMHSKRVVILDRAYEFIIKVDIITAFEESKLSQERLTELIEKDNSLEALYLEWLKIKSNHLSEIRELLEKKSKKSIRKSGSVSKKKVRKKEGK